MASKFAQFLQEKSIDPRRILIASAAIEGLRPEDRALRCARKRARRKDDGAKKPAAAPAEGEAPAARPRSGRPVTERLLRDAQAGKAVSGPEKSRLLRAVNRLLEQKKQETADLRLLF